MNKISKNRWNFLSNPRKYVDASTNSGRPLELQSTTRQFRTARDILKRLNGGFGGKPRRGVLLADDVGLGKTTVAAMVAWVVASEKEGRSVRILAPNEVMMHRWQEELKLHIGPLQECAPRLSAEGKRVKGKGSRLVPGTIQVVKHSYAASDFTLKCDLLIVDEAHRARGENSAFSKALKRQMKRVSHVLVLTATPFSIHLEEVVRMLVFVGGGAAQHPVRLYSKALNDLFTGNTARDPNLVAKELAKNAKSAIEALRTFVIRNGVEYLPKEIKCFGECEEWNMPIPHANPEELELLVRMDRALRVSKRHGSEESKATNDPRFHIGWKHYDQVRMRLIQEIRNLPEPGRGVVESHLKFIKVLRRKVGYHSKMVAVASEVKSVVLSGEKVVLFCRHHSTAQELTEHLDYVLGKVKYPGAPTRSDWKYAWSKVLAKSKDIKDKPLRDTFIEWLCGDLIRTQTLSWINEPISSKTALLAALKRTKSRHPTGVESIADSARSLYVALIKSKSSRSILKQAKGNLENLPGAKGTSRVLGVCEPSDDPKERSHSLQKKQPSLFLQNKQPDTILSIFNSPFGPDVLVLTDKLSEGIDLHRYCRHLIHYELDPSPIRTVQRNGRLRRVKSWASVTEEPIRYAYPAFVGTRDHKLVQIMKNRIGNFSLLLGGVNDFDAEEVVGSEEEWRNSVIEMAKSNLGNSNAQLCG